MSTLWSNKQLTSMNLKRIIYRFLMSDTECRPRWYVRAFAPLYQKRALTSKIYSSVRMDTPPFRRFKLGKHSVIESFSCINNACGDVLIGDFTRVGLGNTIIGPVVIGNNVNLAQGVVVTALNHNFEDVNDLIDKQGITTMPVCIDDDVWIGANVTILQGVRIGKHSVVAAGAVVTKDVPGFTVVAGVPAKVIRVLKNKDCKTSSN